MKVSTSARCRRRWAAQLTTGMVLAAVPAALISSRADGQIPNPEPTAPPGASFLGQVLGWLKWGGLWAAVAGILIGAIAIAVGHFGSNYGAASSGRKWLLGGVAAAAVSGLAWTAANTVYTST